ncbi:hypothetical protein BV22DRAFT_1044475 [Leucogyrophana mollusca]|uniref:Uncharacterized protein n=1 Tax=Leucogyrophana mollusca TaxID=85980 RepID=A0ACB8BVP9_9AGAM|nr:hypothetical protein BV22DRAFT_1044475 [Leucogyrophana mollusca]
MPCEMIASWRAVSDYCYWRVSILSDRVWLGHWSILGNILEGPYDCEPSEVARRLPRAALGLRCQPAALPLFRLSTQGHYQGHEADTQAERARLGNGGRPKLESPILAGVSEAKAASTRTTESPLVDRANGWGTGIIRPRGVDGLALCGRRTALNRVYSRSIGIWSKKELVRPVSCVKQSASDLMAVGAMLHRRFSKRLSSKLLSTSRSSYKIYQDPVKRRRTEPRVVPNSANPIIAEQVRVAGNLFLVPISTLLDRTCSVGFAVWYLGSITTQALRMFGLAVNHSHRSEPNNTKDVTSPLAGAMEGWSWLT